MHALKWLLTFAICAAAGAALANDLMMMGVGPRATGAAAVSCFVLEADGTSKLLLEDGSGCIQLES